MATDETGTSSESAGRSTSTRDSENPEAGRERRPAKKQSARPKKLSPAAVASAAAEQLAGLTGRDAESVTSLERDEDGWKVNVEVVESRRIPDSVDILALYEVQVDNAGQLASYRRVRRYTRGRGEE